jgi:hypothetical protein
VKVRSDIKEAEICAVITRADGTQVQLGRVAYYHRNPLKRWIFAVRTLIIKLRGRGKWPL